MIFNLKQAFQEKLIKFLFKDQYISKKFATLDQNNEAIFHKR